MGVFEYIITFILDDENANDYIYYGNAGESEKPIIIVKSDFWDSLPKSEPKLPLDMISSHEIPFIYGDAKVERLNGQTIIYADLVASAFFLLSRYDEAFLAVARDEHGRPIGKNSFRDRAGLLMRPVVDEYGSFIRAELRSLGYDFPERKGIRKVYLTHDIDKPWDKYTFINGIKESASLFIHAGKIDVSPILNHFGIFKWNICDSFDWLIKNDNSLKYLFNDRVEVIYFVIGVEEETFWTGRYWDDAKFCSILLKLKSSEANIGIHASYEAGLNGELLHQEIANVNSISKSKVEYNRNHYLVSNSVKWLDYLTEDGISDDFTIAYADVVGYRLGTTRCVRWIDPYSLEVKPLCLHPLSIMDSTVMSKQYMGLSVDKMWDTIANAIDISYEHGGDFCFLLHNNVPKMPQFRYWLKLYPRLIDYLIKKMEM